VALAIVGEKDVSNETMTHLEEAKIREAKKIESRQRKARGENGWRGVVRS